MQKKENPFANLLEMKFISQGEHVTVCSMPVARSTMNPNRVAHGGALFSLADNGMGRAIQRTLNETEMSASIEIKMSYFRAVRDGELACEARIVKSGKRVVFAEADLFNHEKLVAKATGSFSIFTPSKTKKD